MKKLIALLALAIIALPSVSEACWFPGKKLVEGIAARRDAGKGIGQKSGPIRGRLNGTR